MKTLVYLVILSLFLFSCDSEFAKEHLEQESTLPEVSSYRFLELKKEPNFETIEIDSLQNFGAVIKNMEILTCAGKSFGLTFTENDTIYQLTGSSGCPDDTSIPCYFRVNELIIKNDSLKNYSGDWDKIIPIQNLSAELKKIVDNEFSFRWDTNVLKPTMISLYIDDKFPIEKTKAVLKTITQEFNNINAAHGDKNYLPYFILFENYSCLDIPAPPPPPPLPAEDIKEIELD